MKKVLCVFGTRPEAIKMAPLVHELKKHPDCVEPVVCVTGQHREMLDQILDTFEITPEIDLNLMQKNQSLSSLTAGAIQALEGVLGECKPELVLVQGDTTTAMAGALAAHYHKVPVGHVEAGLRTGNRYDPFPEEVNRRLIGVLTSYHFAPTQASVDALIAEGYPPDSVFLTGNTVVDALLMTRAKNAPCPAETLCREGRRIILVTAHRRENFDGPLRNICAALRQIVDRYPDVELIYPVHLNPNVQGPVLDRLSGHDRIHLIEPLGYKELVGLLDRCYMVLTDSGGIQEEAPALGKPVLVMRNTTERPEGVEAGVAKLTGTETDAIFDCAERLLSDRQEYDRMARALNPYGDGHASERILQVILNTFEVDNQPARSNV